MDYEEASKDILDHFVAKKVAKKPINLVVDPKIIIGQVCSRRRIVHGARQVAKLAPWRLPGIQLTQF